MHTDRFTTIAQQTLAAAQADAVTRQNPEVTGLHVLSALLAEQGGPVWSVLSKAGAKPDQVAGVAQSELGRLPTTSSGAGSGGRSLVEIMTKADAEAKTLGDSYVSTEHLLLSLAEVAGPAKEVLSTFGLSRKVLAEAIGELRKASGVSHVTDQDSETQYEALKKYAIDLTEKAQQGKLDPVIGRDEEIRRCMQVLSRRTKNNPVLIGEPGVGKTAIAEGLSLRIVQGVPRGNLWSR